MNTYSTYYYYYEPLDITLYIGDTIDISYKNSTYGKKVTIKDFTACHNHCSRCSSYVSIVSTDERYPCLNNNVEQIKIISRPGAIHINKIMEI